ncbi:MAG TPA: hypothetical protein VL401_02145 [Alphaproteobacteria bacterium]|jgi:hypothetical protein|nr:hypothetical protein [Alphaproteobacteria bacterium]
MNNPTGSVCTRCGKQRVVVGTSEEVIGNSTIIHTETACPDKACQIAVDDKMVKEREKREQMSASSKFGVNPRNSKRSDSL